MTTPAPFDFRQPPAGASERQLRQWLQEASRRAILASNRLLPFSLQLQVGTVELGPFSRLVADVPDHASGYAVSTSAVGDGQLWLLIPRPLLLALLAGLIGETPQQWPQDREPTDLEAALIDYLLRELFLCPLEQAWPEPPLHLTATPGRPVRTLGQRPPAELAYRFTLSAITPWGEQSFWLCIPRQGRWEQLGLIPTSTQPAELPAAWRTQVENLVQTLPVEVTVLLGEVDTTMRRLAQLKVGDVLILRQSVRQPLLAQVDGIPRFRVWPGTHGGRTAVLIEGLTPGPSCTSTS